MTKFLNNADVKGYISQTDVTSSLLKTDSSGKLVAAVAGTDYQTPTALASADRMVTVGRNATGATLYKGTIVYISGSTGNRPNFVKAQANSEATSAGTFGVVYADIPNNSDGNVVNIGVIDTLDTRASAPNPFTSDLLVDGDTLYLSPDTAGYVTKTKPSAPNHLVYVGKVTRTSPTNGTIVYRIQNGYELNEIHDVAIATLANNHTLVWESATNLWKNKTIAAALGYTPADDSSVVKLTGDQTVAGVKTFSSVINASTLSLNGGVLSGNNIVSMRSNPTGGQFRIEKSDGSLSAYPFYIGVDGTALAYYYNAAGALKVLLHTNDTSYFGNSLSVGYSTYASTSYMLDVNGTVRLTGALSGTSASFNSTLTTTGGTRSIQLVSYSADYNYLRSNGAPLVFGTQDSQDLYIQTNNTTRLTLVTSTGAATFSSSVTAPKLLVNTTDVGSGLFQIAGSGRMIEATYSAASNGNAIRIDQQNAGGSGISSFALMYLINKGANPFITLSNGTNDIFTIQQNGNVGIGTTSPSDKLHVHYGSGVAASIRIESSSSGQNSSIIYVSGGVNRWEVGTGISSSTSYEIYDRANSASRLRLSTAGQLQFLAYTSSSSFSGTAAGYLAFDSSGNVITVAGVAATDNTKLPLAGGTMTGALVVNTTGIANSPSVRINTSSSASFVHTQENFAANLVAGQRAMIFFGKVGSTKNAGGIGYYWAGDGSNSNFITLGHWGNDDLLRVYGDGTIQATGYLRTAGITTNTVVWSAGASSADFGNVLGQGTSSRSTMFRGNGSSTSVWWGGTDGLGNVIPFTAIDATSGEFTFWRNSGGTGGGNWTNIMTMNASGLTINSGSFIGNLSGNASSSTYSSSVYIGGSSSKLIGDSVWAGTSGYPGYSFTGGNSRFGFSSTSGYIDVYTDGNFYAGIDLNGSNNLVLHAGNYNSYSPTLTGGNASGTWGINISGNATSVSGLTINNSGAPINPDNATQNSIGYNNSVSLFGQTDGGLYSSAYNSSWIHQIYGDFRTGQIAIRGKNSGTWQSWRTVLDSTNTPGALGAKYQINDTWLRVNSDSSQFQIYGNSRTLIYRTDGNTNPHGGGGYAHIFYYGGSADGNRVFIVNTDGRLYSPYHGWLDTMSISGSAGSLSNMNISQFTNNSGYQTSSGTVTNAYNLYLNGGQAGGITLNEGRTGVYRTEGGSGGTMSYAPLLHVGGGDTMWQIQGSYGGGTTLQWRSGYAGTWYSWWTIVHSGNQPYAYNLNQYVNINSDVQFGNGGSDAGIRINQAGTGYGRIRFYQDGSNYATIHAFGTTSGYSPSVGCINIDGTNGTTIGPWNAPHLQVNSSGLRIGSTSSSNIWMTDSDETTRRIHCNSNRIGFLNSSDGWGAWCDNDGGWQTSASFSAGSQVYANGHFRPSGDYGLYSQDYGGVFRRNTNSYGTWESVGYAKNGWGGYVNNNNYIVSWMLNTSGDFGFLTQNGNWWNLFYNNGNNCWGIGTDNTYSGDGFRCIKYGSSQYGWTTWSDRRAKENIKSITGALDKVLNMRGVYFNYISDEAKNKRVGFIAQELEEVLPEAVRYAEEIDEYNVEYAQIVSVLAEAIKEQNTEIQSLRAQLQTLLN